VIDSKTSLRSYEDAVNLVDDAARELALQAHIEALRDHARDLGKKRYQDLYGINAPDFVLMYIPIEAAYLSALSRVPSLFAEALDDNIVLITNSSLLGTLRTVSNVWQLADQQKNATDIAERGGALYDKFVGFVENMQAVGKAIDASQEAWSDANKQLHTGRGNLVSQASKLRALGAKSTKLLSPELTESAVESSDTAAVLTAAEKKGLPAPAASPSSN
jgi:DNA recombination protein RmuC